MHITVEKLPNWPENCNPMLQDISNMGLTFATDYCILHPFHHNEDIKPFVIVNTRTGERSRITICEEPPEEEIIADYNAPAESYHNYWW